MPELIKQPGLRAAACRFELDAGPPLLYPSSSSVPAAAPADGLARSLQQQMDDRRKYTGPENDDT